MGLIALPEMLAALEKIPRRSIKLSPIQKKILQHGEGPLWVIAGPGSGKTEVLILRCLKLLLVDGVNPKSIIVTTFTEKAAKNLQDRLTTYKYYLANDYPEVAKVDLFQVRAGTLHSLCNDIMLEYRYPGYKDYRPLDDMEQLLFIYFNSDLAVAPKDLPTKINQLWNRFAYVWARGQKGQTYLREGWKPSRWMRARAAQLILNRITEDLLNTDKMRSEGKELAILAEAYDQYEKALESHFRVDFAHMQKKFLDFLEIPLGKRFLEGTDETVNPGLSHVLVDEYQDTNPIQEAIYLRLADRKPHNICVVGDDDQALYRFRGATVECMINFGKVCSQRWDVKVQDIPLAENYRSHPRIIDWINEYIESFDAMKVPGARVPGKHKLLWSSKIEGDWPAVAVISAFTKKDLGTIFAKIVNELLQNKIIDCPSDCVLLMRSTRETRRWAGPFADSLEEEGIPVYNPRSRKYLEQEEVEVALGALLEILDPNPDYDYVPPSVQEVCNRWRAAYLAISKSHQNLSEYVTKAQTKIKGLKRGEYIRSSLQEIMYHILSFEPFRTWLEVPDRTVRLGQLTRLLEAFCSTPISGHPGLSRGNLRMSWHQPGKISWQWRQTFYNSFLTLIQEEGLNDPEDEEAVYPRDTLPIMTVHQAKGLEFPFVFVGGLDEKCTPDIQHELEEDFISFREAPFVLPPAQERAMQDMVRFYYVAYSRARYALILLTKQDDLHPGESEGSFISLGGKDIGWFKRYVETLREHTKVLG